MSVRARMMAWMYDRTMRETEARGLAAMRDELLAGAAGTVLEIGAGTGANLGRYGAGVERLLLSEPEPAMRTKLQAKLEAPDDAPPAVAARAEVLPAPGEGLPVDAASVDTVVSTLVMCSVRDLDAAVAEAHRVLRPGGRLLLLEHVADEHDPRNARWQRWLQPLWRCCCGNCHLTRRTGAAVEQGGFAFTQRELREMPAAPKVARPLLFGVARRA